MEEDANTVEIEEGMLRDLRVNTPVRGRAVTSWCGAASWLSISERMPKSVPPRM